MKSKTWEIEIKAEITNSSEDGEIENKQQIVDLIEDALDLGSYGWTLGEFGTEIKKLKVKLK